VLRHITCDLKSISFYESHLPLISDRRFKANDHIKILSNIKDYEAKLAVVQRFRGVKYQLPNSEELEEQFLSGSLLDTLVSKKSKQYNSTIFQITEAIISTNSETTSLEYKKKTLSKFQTMKDRVNSFINNLKSGTKNQKVSRGTQVNKLPFKNKFFKIFKKNKGGI